MYIAILDYKHNCVDIIQLDDSVIPKDFNEEWLAELLKYNGYDDSECCWMCSETPIQIRTLFSMPSDKTEEIRKAQIVDGKTSKSWN